MPKFTQDEIPLPYATHTRGPVTSTFSLPSSPSGVCVERVCVVSQSGSQSGGKVGSLNFHLLYLKQEIYSIEHLYCMWTVSLCTVLLPSLSFSIVLALTLVIVLSISHSLSFYFYFSLFRILFLFLSLSSSFSTNHLSLSLFISLMFFLPTI